MPSSGTARAGASTVSVPCSAQAIVQLEARCTNCINRSGTTRYQDDIGASSVGGAQHSSAAAKWTFQHVAVWKSGRNFTAFTSSTHTCCKSPDCRTGDWAAQVCTWQKSLCNGNQKLQYLLLLFLTGAVVMACGVARLSWPWCAARFRSHFVAPCLQAHRWFTQKLSRGAMSKPLSHHEVLIMIFKAWHCRTPVLRQHLWRTSGRQ